MVPWALDLGPCSGSVVLHLVVHQCGVSLSWVIAAGGGAGPWCWLQPVGNGCGCVQCANDADAVCC